MESKFRDGILLVKLEGKIDTSNAALVEKEIFGLLDHRSYSAAYRPPRTR